MIKRAPLRTKAKAFLLPFLASLAASCLLPMSPEDYAKALAGPPSLVYEGFETNDGTMPTSYKWQTASNDTYGSSSSDSDPRTTDVWSWEGSYSLAFNASEYDMKGMALAVDASAGSVLSYVIHLTDNYWYDIPSTSEICAVKELDDRLYSPGIDALTCEKLPEEDTFRVRIVLPVACSSITFLTGNAYIDDLRINLPESFGPVPDSFFSGASAELAWEAFPGAASYRIQVSADSRFAAPIADVSDLGPSPYRSSIPASSNHAYWRVGAVGASPYSTIWSEPRHLYKITAWRDEGFESSTVPGEWIADGAVLTTTSSPRHSGSRALQATVTGSGCSILRAADFGEGGILRIYFDYGYTSSILAVRVDGDLVASKSSDSVNWTPIMAEIPPGPHSIKISWSSDANLYLDDIEVMTGVSLLDTEDFESGMPAAIASSTGSIEISGTNPHGGSSSLRLFAPVSNYTRAIAYVSCKEASTLSFWLKLDATADDFYVAIDGSSSYSYYPLSWTRISRDVPAGVHLVEFSYRSSVGTRSAYVDDIILE